jgi:hypothetical protein
MQEVFVQQSPGKVRVFWKANDEPQSRIYIAADFDFAPDQTATALESWSLNRQYKCTRVNDTESFTGFELIDNGLSSSVLFDDEFGKDYGGSAHGGESNSDAGEGATLTYSGSAIAIDGSTQSSGSTSAVLSIVSRYVDESVNIGQRLASLTRTYSIDGATRTLTVDVSLTPDRDIKCQVFYPAMYGSLPSFYTSAVWSDNTTVDLTDSSGGPSFAWGPFGGSSITISGPNITTVFTQTAGDSSNGIRIGPNSTSRKIYPLNLLGETAPANTPQASQFTKNTTISEPE